MEMKIIEVTLALVAIYLVMALAATQINELWAARFKRRPHVLIQVINEVFDRQPALIDDFFNYAPIYALSQGERKPAAVPADLFATAFLAVLNDKKPPRSEFRTPAEFVAARIREGSHLGQVLEAQMAGVEADWNAFEKKIARWFTDICDRAEGWYKRETASRLLVVSGLLTLVLNVDSAFIARTLMENDVMRVSFANIGELLADQLADEQRGVAGLAVQPREKLTSAAESEDPFLVSGDLKRALGDMRSALSLDPNLVAFGPDKGTLARECVDKGDGGREKLFDSNYEAWTYLLVSIMGQIEAASLGISDSDNAFEEWPDRIVKIRKAMMCTTGIARWVYGAHGSTKNEKAKAHLETATVSLESARKRMQTLIVRASVPSHLTRSYALLGQGFVDCAYEAGGSRAAFDNCLGSANANVVPFGWPGRAGQFCRLTMRPPDAAASTAAGTQPAKTLTRAADSDFEGWDAWWGCQDFQGDSALRLPAIYARVSPSKLFGALFGWILTAVLVSLGAPFWYGLLGKVAQLRIAGRVRGLGDPASEIVGENPVPGPAAGTTLATTAKTGTAATPFDSARNEYERAMPPKEISRLQIALGVRPTMNLDEVTRNAIAERLEALGQPPERELSPSTYFMIVGRNSTQVAVDAPSSAIWSVGTREPAVRQLVAALNRLFSPGLPALDEREVFDHEVRARVVLFRYKSDPATSPAAKKVVALAGLPGSELLRLDDTTRRSILACQASALFAPDPSKWLDYALGELGVDEDSAEGRTRVNEYLAITLGSTGPKSTAPTTSWCGAFVAWVLIRAGVLASGKARTHLLQAARWADYGTSTPGKRGDICMVDSGNGIHHVAFLIEIDAQGRHWLLGGNQGGAGSGAVTLVRFRAACKFTYVPTDKFPH